MKRRRVTEPAGKRRVARKRRVESLVQHLGSFGSGEEGRAGKLEFAKRCGTSLAYLEHLAQGFRQASMPMAIKIEQQSYGIVRAEDLHPQGDWAYLQSRKPRMDGESHA